MSPVQERVSVRLGKKKCDVVRTRARFGMAGKEKNAMSPVQEHVLVRPGKEELRFRRDSEFRELYEKTAFPVL